MDASRTIADKYNIDSGAIDQTTLQGGGGTVLAVKNSGITTTQIADLSVTTAKIADLNVTTAKIADLNVTTDKIAYNAITSDKILDGSVTKQKLSALSINQSSDCGNYVLVSTAETDISNLSATVGTSGRPVCLLVGPSNDALNPSNTYLPSGKDMVIRVRRTGLFPLLLATVYITNPTASAIYMPLNFICYDFSPGSGTASYKVTVESTNISGSLAINYVRLTAYGL